MNNNDRCAKENLKTVGSLFGIKKIWIKKNWKTKNWKRKLEDSIGSLFGIKKFWIKKIC